MHFPKPTRCYPTTSDEIIMYGSDDLLHCAVLFDADPCVLAVSIQRGRAV